MNSSHQERVGHSPPDLELHPEVSNLLRLFLAYEKKEPAREEPKHKKEEMLQRGSRGEIYPSTYTT